MVVPIEGDEHWQEVKKAEQAKEAKQEYCPKWPKSEWAYIHNHLHGQDYRHTPYQGIVTDSSLC